MLGLRHGPCGVLSVMSSGGAVVIPDIPVSLRITTLCQLVI